MSSCATALPSSSPDSDEWSRGRSGAGRRTRQSTRPAASGGRAPTGAWTLLSPHEERVVAVDACPRYQLVGLEGRGPTSRLSTLPFAAAVDQSGSPGHRHGRDGQNPGPTSRVLRPSRCVGRRLGLVDTSDGDQRRAADNHPASRRGGRRVRQHGPPRSRPRAPSAARPPATGRCRRTPLPADQEVLFLPHVSLGGAHVKAHYRAHEPAHLDGRVPRPRRHLHRPARHRRPRRARRRAVHRIPNACWSSTSALWLTSAGELPAGAPTPATSRRSTARIAAPP